MITPQLWLLTQKFSETLKKALSNFSDIFVKLFKDFGITKKPNIFLIIHGEFHSWKVFHLEDINENVPGYGNHN